MVGFMALYFSYLSRVFSKELILHVNESVFDARVVRAPPSLGRSRKPLITSRLMRLYYYIFISSRSHDRELSRVPHIKPTTLDFYTIFISFLREF